MLHKGERVLASGKIMTFANLRRQAEAATSGKPAAASPATTPPGGAARKSERILRCGSASSPSRDYAAEASRRAVDDYMGDLLLEPARGY